MKPSPFSFPKEERLCSRKLIRSLYAKEETLSHLQFPILGVWKFTVLPAGVPAQVMVNAPKKKFRRAHDRNLIKRQMREAYRLSKQPLLETLSFRSQQCAISLTFVGKEHVPYAQIEQAVRRILKKIAGNIPKPSEPVADGHVPLL